MSPSGNWRDHLSDLDRCKPWPRYYHFRAQEMDLVEKQCRLPQGGTMLELGCGNAFHSYLLSERFDTCIASDLHQEDARTHTIGLERARTLADILGFDRLQIVAATAERLPFATGSIDFVFSSNVLEHVPDRLATVAEIYRVLRPGGMCLTIVPAAMERVYNLPVSYVRIIHSIALGLREHIRQQGTSSVADCGLPSNGGAAPLRRSFLRKALGFPARHYPGFPFPKPHGEYDSSTEEFLAHRPGQWEALFRTQPFTFRSRFTTILAPHVLGMGLSYGMAYWVARAGQPLTKLLGSRYPFRALGTSYAMLVQRPADEAA